MISAIFFVTSLDSGGLENYLLRFLQEKHQEFNNVYVWCKSGRRGQLEGEFLKLKNVEIVTKSFSYLSFQEFKKLKVFIQEKSIDAVCDFTGNFSGRVLKTAKQGGVLKRVAMYRGATDHFKNSFLRNIYNDYVKWLTYRYATDILSNSKAAFNYFYPKVWKQEERFKVIYNGINADKYINEKKNLRKQLGIPHDAFVVGHTGRYTEAKNHSIIIEVAECLTNKYNDIYFILCGNGVKENLQGYLSRNALTNRIIVFENRTDIPVFLNTMDCFLFPSITEGQPNSLIEAMIVGLPFVASNIPSIEETIRLEDKKQLISPLDKVAAIEKIIYCKTNKNTHDSTGLSRWSIEKYNAKRQFDEFFKVIIK